VISPDIAAKRSPEQERRVDTTVSLSEVLDAGLRFEAAAFNVEARALLKELRASGLRLVALFGTDGICHWCSKPIRMRRHFVTQERGVPLLSSSDIISLRPEAKGYISRKLTKGLGDLMITAGDLLVSRSGTVGSVALAGLRIEQFALTEEDALRLRARQRHLTGYAAAFLRTRYGRAQLTAGKYGSVVTHIEPAHLKRVLVPRPDPIAEVRIGEAMLRAVDLRDEANSLIDQAIGTMVRALGLPPLRDFVEESSSSLENVVRLSQLNDRFEGSYHNPIVYEALTRLQGISCGITTLSDQKFVREIRPITKFRKRTYVEMGGIPLFSSKQIFQVDPIDVKRLAKGAHAKDLPEIALETNMLAITCSGTIGRVQIIPRYMEGWTANQHATRLIASNPETAGFLFAWLSSAYGQSLIRRYSYGSVILEIDKDMIGQVPVPLVPEALRAEVGGLVLRANSLRDDAWRSESDAIREVTATVRKTRV
jgi:type I restriction enzyme S subunit